MGHRFGQFLMLLILGASMPVAARGQDAAAKVDELFGEAIREVKATPTQEDDVKLARDLLAAAQADSQDAATAVALCDAVYGLASPATGGLDVAAEAIELLGQHAPERAADCGQKALVIRRRQYIAATGANRAAAGEHLIEALENVVEALVKKGQYAEAITYLRQASSAAAGIRSSQKGRIQAEIDRLVALDRLHRVIRELEARLKADPKDDYARRRLIDLYLIELDDPTRAAALLGQDADEALRTYIPLAVKEVSELKPGACLEVGNWYYGLRTKATTPMGKPAMLRRAQGYLERYVQEADAGDLTVVKAKLTLEKIEKELDALAPAGPWLDVLKLVNPSKHAVRGRWLRQGRRIGVAATGHDRVMIPIAPKGDYELKVQFARSKGDGDVNVVLPVGAACVTLALSEHRARASGLSAVDGSFHRDKEAPASAGLSNRATHNVHVKVTTKDGSAKIRASLDGKKLLDWSGTPLALSVTDEWRLPNKTVLGLGTYSGCTTTFAGAQLRMLTGRAAPVEIAVRNESDARREWWRDIADRWRRAGGRTPRGGNSGRRR
jgi:tetratricopeptide (TPR) repeat protein